MKLSEDSSVIDWSFGIVMGLTRNPRWLLLPLAVQTFFLQHALKGWCPPVPILRRVGVRTIDEINYERYSLKVLRGDFDKLPSIDKSKGAAHIAAETVHTVTS